ncbi:MAG: hypothetical protein JNK30_20935 [Phenylobacterium sp.]|uniref:hypothetical protein n=1 Tax=Phenylobacterium sp. TaxID=1871053 RepID=UPI001A396A03|nr:hypothetical protein [Phenylobacterium sp.]MBL8773865.1 hypothetical protein [Phenylobacterium sp.]
MFAAAFRTAALVVCALSLGLSFAHLLEAPPRLWEWPADLWREATVFHGQYALFAAVGGPVEILGVVLAAVVAALALPGRERWTSAAASAALYVAALAVWLLVVNAANGAMADWRPGPLPADFRDVQRRWEAGHAVMAFLKLAGFSALAWHVAGPRRLTVRTPSP